MDNIRHAGKCEQCYLSNGHTVSMVEGEICLSCGREDVLPNDYECCSICGYDHEYDKFDYISYNNIVHAHNESSFNLE